MRGIFLMACLWAALNASGAGLDLARWMGEWPDSARLFELSIPGTHDAGARFEPLPGTSKCQNLTIRGQLEAGVRFLDIRCRHVKDAFVIHHGPVNQHATFDDVLAEVRGFLDEHPTEAVVMSIQQEYTPEGNSRSFEETFDAYVSKEPDRWLLEGGNSALGGVRGKIVLFRRFPAGVLPKGIDASRWPDNTAFDEGELRVQDRYVVRDNDEKWEAITKQFREAARGPADTLFVNFTSGYRPGAMGIPDIRTVAGDINARLAKWLDTEPPARRGIVVMDFADAEMCARVIQRPR